MDIEQERTLLDAQKEALEREIEYINLEAAKYKVFLCHLTAPILLANRCQERHADLGQQNKAMEIEADAAGDAIMIDPALEESSAQATETSPSDLSSESTFNG